MGETTERIRSSGGQAFAISTDGPKLTALCDGYLDLDLSRFPAVVRGVGDGLAAADGQDLDDLCVSVNCFLIEAPGRLCLIDAGDGSRRGASLGHLRRALKAAGYEAGDVTDLLMTHLHGDHAAGLVEAGRPIFPNADLHVSAEEHRFWNTPEEHDPVQATQTPLALAALDAYRERTCLFEPGGEILPGVRTTALPGHTPGQVGYRIGNEKPVLVSADVLHMPALQVARPEWGFLFDVDGALALRTRLALLEEIAATGMRIAGAHIPFPGTIRVGRRDGGLVFETAVD